MFVDWAVMESVPRGDFAEARIQIPWTERPEHGGESISQQAQPTAHALMSKEHECFLPDFRVPVGTDLKKEVCRKQPQQKPAAAGDGSKKKEKESYEESLRA